MPLQKLVLKNFQAHAKFALDLDTKVSVLVGASDVGKSSVLRALRWLACNKPLGDAFVRDGKDGCSVKLRLDDQEVERERSKSVNAWRLNGQLLEGDSSRTVPEGVERLLNLDEALNFASQFAAPFWLTKTGGDLAKELNQVVNLDLIDRTLANLASRLKETRREAKTAEDRLETLQTAFDDLGWALSAEEDCVALAACQDAWQGSEDGSRRLEAVLGDLIRYEGILNNASIPSLDGLDEQGRAAADAAVRATELETLLIAISSAQVESCRTSELSAAANDDLKKVKACPVCERPFPKSSA